jgi:ABC-type Zn uptake system ZnuABC Zn-binding protein ZnuA
MRWLVILGVFLAGCDSGDSSKGKDRPAAPTAAATARKVSVLATAYPLAEMARRVGGAFVDVQWLCEGGQRPEDLESTAELRQRANAAQLVITSGPWDGWAVAELTPVARKERVVEPERVAAAARDHDRRAYAWLDPAVMRQVVEAVRLRLSVVAPEHDATYRANAAAYLDEVAAVERDLDAALSSGLGQRVVVVRPAWNALLARYRIVPLAPSRAGAETEVALTGPDFKELARHAHEQHTKYLFVEAATPAAVRLRIEEQTGLTAVPLDALGTSAPDGRSTWGKVMRFDAAQVRKGWE